MQKVSFNLPATVVDYLDLEAKRHLPQLNRTQLLSIIIWFYTENKIKVLEWRGLCIALLQKIKSVFDGLIYHTDKPDINSNQKLHNIKEMADHIPFGFEEKGILSGVNILNPSTSIDDIFAKLFENLRKIQI